MTEKSKPFSTDRERLEADASPAMLALADDMRDFLDQMGWDEIAKRRALLLSLAQLAERKFVSPDPDLSDGALPTEWRQSIEAYKAGYRAARARTSPAPVVENAKQRALDAFLADHGITNGEGSFGWKCGWEAALAALSQPPSSPPPEVDYVERLQVLLAALRAADRKDVPGLLLTAAEDSEFIEALATRTDPPQPSPHSFEPPPGGKIRSGEDGLKGSREAGDQPVLDSAPHPLSPDKRAELRELLAGSRLKYVSRFEAGGRYADLLVIGEGGKVGATNETPEEVFESVACGSTVVANESVARLIITAMNALPALLALASEPTEKQLRREFIDTLKAERAER